MSPEKSRQQQTQLSVLVAFITFLMFSLVIVNTLIYISIPKHVTASSTTLQIKELSNRISALDSFVATHQLENNANKGKIVHEKMNSRLSILEAVQKEYVALAKDHYSQDYFEVCKMAWKELETRVILLENNNEY